MKSFAILAAGLGFALAAPAPFALPEPELSGLEGKTLEYVLHKRDSNDGVPAGTYLEKGLDTGSSPPTAGAKFTKIRQGPFTVRAMSAAENQPVMNVQKPCSNCYIVAIQAGLEYADGSLANIDKGAWLHHMVLYNAGLGKTDPTCPLSPQRLFASGNERTTIRTNGKYKYGINIGLMDSLGMIIDLMNESKNSQTFYLTMTYEWLPQTASGYKPAAMAWLDVAGNCLSTSEVTARTGSYTLTSQPWRSNVNGRLLSATGHVHDGGALVTIMQNGQAICRSEQLYGRRPGYGASPMDGMNMGSGDMNMGVGHISDTGSCVDFGQIKMGDTLNIKADYQTTKYPLMKKMSGVGLEPIMGISQIYIGT